MCFNSPSGAPLPRNCYDFYSDILSNVFRSAPHVFFSTLKKFQLTGLYKAFLRFFLRTIPTFLHSLQHQKIAFLFFPLVCVCVSDSGGIFFIFHSFVIQIGFNGVQKNPFFNEKSLIIFVLERKRTLTHDFSSGELKVLSTRKNTGQLNREKKTFKTV